MTDEMLKEEIETILGIAVPDAQLCRYERNCTHNFISVWYWIGEVMHQIDFLPDDIYIISDGDKLDGKPISDGNKLLSYRKFMVARGYSELWLNNPYIK